LDEGEGDGLDDLLGGRKMSLLLVLLRLPLEALRLELGLKFELRSVTSKEGGECTVVGDDHPSDGNFI